MRSLLHVMGYRFRLHRRDLPGRPDIVLPRYRTVLFVHGCFWHRHPCCRFAYTPKSNVAFWKNKFDKNVSRDLLALRALNALEWRVVILWECETMNEQSLKRQLLELLS